MPVSGIDAEVVVTAAEVLHERVATSDHADGPVGLQAPHRLFANAAARSVTTSSGSPCATSAELRNLRAAAMSRRRDTT